MPLHSYRISLQNKIKKVPPPQVWGRAIAESSSSIIETCADVEIVYYKCFGLLKLVRAGYAYCLIGTKGYVVIYREVCSEFAGYTFDLTSAKSLRVKEGFDASGESVEMKIVIKWKFGELIIRPDFEDFKAVKSALSAAFKKPRVTSDIYEKLGASQGTDRISPHHDSYDDEEKVKEKSARTVAVRPFSFASSIPLPPVRQNDGALVATYSLSDDQADALRSFVSNSNSGLSMQICVSGLQSDNDPCKDDDGRE